MGWGEEAYQSRVSQLLHVLIWRETIFQEKGMTFIVLSNTFHSFLPSLRTYAYQASVKRLYQMWDSCSKEVIAIVEAPAPVWSEGHPGCDTAGPLPSFETTIFISHFFPLSFLLNNRFLNALSPLGTTGSVKIKAPGPQTALPSQDSNSNQGTNPTVHSQI